MKKRMFLTAVIVLYCLLILNFKTADAHEQEKNNPKENLLQLSVSTQLDYLIDNGLVLPPDFAAHRELAGSFIRHYLPIILEKGPSYKVFFNYDQSIKYYENLIETLISLEMFSGSYEMETRYVLQDSTAIGTWLNSYLYYNCYAYAIGASSMLIPGQIKYPSGSNIANPFSMSMTISAMADLVLEDLDAMNCWGYKTTTKPTALPDSYFKIIFIRKDDTYNNDFILCVLILSA